MSRVAAGVTFVLALAGLPQAVAAPPANLDQPPPCTGSGCAEVAPAWQAMQKASAWMSRFPDGELQFDAAIMLSQIETKVDGDALRRASKLARALADRDADHPHRRFYDPSFRSPRKDTASWVAPSAGGARVSPNFVLSEALHCAENGWRAETNAYVCGPMRDAGGYHTVHGLWALLIARENGCLQGVPDCSRSLIDELLAAQPERLEPKKSLDVDLYAERLLMLQKSGIAGSPIDAGVTVLLANQDADGSFGVRIADEPPYFRFHTTAIATWALAEWYASHAGQPGASTPTPLPSDEAR